MSEIDYREMSPVDPERCMKRMLLEVEQFGMEKLIDKCLIEHSVLGLEDLVHGNLRGLLMKLTAYMASAKVEVKVCSREVSYPATWWDAFKKEAIPTFTKWFGLKVHYKHLVCSVGGERLIVFPEVKVPRKLGKSYIKDSIAVEYDEYDTVSIG